MPGSETALTLDSVTLGDAQSHRLAGPKLLERLLDTAARYVEQLRARVETRQLPARVALFGRVRGTGPGVSFTHLYERLRQAFPNPLVAPFEECDNVAGAVLESRVLIAPERDDAMLILRFEAGACDLPMHAHEDSERFIYVVSGRGLFHVSSEAVGDFTGETIRHVPVRASDVLMFSRGTVHTFSTGDEPLLLLSCHAPYVPLESAEQYTIPAVRVCPGRSTDPEQSRIACDAAWLCVA
ncbi:MAG: cupin domain-containing protein [Gammaproteobacteria bacterium]|nr:cupin domain-containing protein [Gammaproteobacteria bacterium]